MIRLEHITKVFNAGTAGELTALNDIHLTISKGEFVSLIGSNGSGKSTLLNVLAGTIKADKGKIFIGENEVSRLAEYQRSRWIARVFQNPLAGTASELSILENFRLSAIRTQSKTLNIGTGVAFRKLITDKIAGLGLGLENKLDQPMGNLSGGQRQALTLLMAVMDDVELLLMDEPTAALDPKTAALVMTLANRIIREHKLTAILITHNLKDALAFGSRLLMMKEGVVEKDIIKSENKTLELKDLLELF